MRRCRLKEAKNTVIRYQLILEPRRFSGGYSIDPVTGSFGGVLGLLQNASIDGESCFNPTPKSLHNFNWPSLTWGIAEDFTYRSSRMDHFTSTMPIDWTVVLLCLSICPILFFRKTSTSLLLRLLSVIFSKFCLFQTFFRLDDRFLRRLSSTVAMAVHIVSSASDDCRKVHILPFITTRKNKYFADFSSFCDITFG